MSASLGGSALASRTDSRREWALLALLCAGPPLALLGNAPSDAWLVSVVAVFLVRSAVLGDWAWTQALWLRAAAALWVWLVITALLSEWPEKAIEEAATWIRFPVFAAALGVWLGGSPRRFDMLSGAALLCAGALALLLFAERLQDPAANRLFGLWGAPKPGWYILGLGLPAALWLAVRGFDDRRAALGYGAAAVAALLLATAVNTGEIGVTASFALGLGLFTVFGGFRGGRAALLALAALAGVAVLLLASVDGVSDRFSRAADRMPWMAQSDYYDPWVGGLRIGAENWLTGVGTDLYRRTCDAIDAARGLESLGIGRCTTHPHQLYIQAFAEAGVIGLLLMAAVTGFLWRDAFARLAARPGAASAAAAALAVMLLFPLATYSDAFGQHKNFFTWYGIGCALAFGGLMTQSRANRAP